MKKLLVSVLGMGFAISALAVDHPYCYWTGAVNTSVDEPGNWKDADGNVLTAAPGDDAYLVFTNITTKTGLTVTKSKNYNFYGYIVRDCTADIKLGTSKAIQLNAGGVSQESSSGSFYLNYTTTTYGGTNVIDVTQPGASVVVQNGFNRPSSNKAKEVVVKRGSGTFLSVAVSGSTFAIDHRELLLEGGIWQIRSAEKNRRLENTILTFGGNDCDFNFGYDYALTNVTLRETAAADVHTHGFSGSGTLTFAGSELADTTFHGRFRDSISPTWNPSTAAKLTLAGATHPTTGKLTVSNGEVALTDGARFTALGELEVADGAVLSMAAGTDLFVSEMTAGTQGKVKLAAGVQLVAGKVTAGGQVYQSGVLTKDNCDWIEGDGAIALGYKQATWTGGGATSSIADPMNWNWCGAMPSLWSGELVATFPADAVATVPSEGGPFSVKGLVFADAGVSLGGEGTLEVGDEGLVVQGDGASVTVGCPVSLNAAAVPFDVAEGAELTFVSQGVSGGTDFPAANLTMQGAGMTVFAAGAAAQNLGTMTILPGATMKIASDAGDCTVGTTTVLDAGGTLIVGRDFAAGKRFTWNGLVRLQAGRIGAKDDGTSNCTLGATADLTVEGPAAKRYHVYSNNSMTIRNYAETDDAAGTLSLTVYTSKSPTLTFRGTKSTRFTGKIYNTAQGNYTLTWAPTDTTAVLEVARSTYDNATYKGQAGFAVSAGTLRFADGATLTAKSIVTAAAGATLAFGTGACSVAGGSITVADGATFALEDGWMQSVASGVLTIEGEAIADGQYMAGKAGSPITGRGLLLVGPQTDPAPDPHVWTGGGATTSLTDPDNWDLAPNFIDGSLLATFPADAQVSLPATDVCRLRGIRFAGESPSFTLTGGGRVYLGADGLTALGAESEVTIDTPVTFEKDLTICVTNKLILTENGVLSAMDLSTILTLACGGSVEIRSSNPCLGIVKASGTIHVYADNALGDARATFIQTGGTANDVLVLHGCSLDCVIDLRGGSRLSHLRAQEGVSFLNGLVKPTGGPNEERFACMPGAELHFRGGVTYTGSNNGASWSPVSSYTIHVDDKPMVSTRIALGGVDSGDEGALYLNVASNRFPRGVVFRNANAKSNVLYTTVPYALYADGTSDDTSGVTFGETAANAVWDLCGCDQGAGVFFSRTTAAVVTSETPATLHLVDNALNYVKTSELGSSYLKVSLLGTASQVDRTCFAGAAGFSKEGSYTHYMMGTSTSAGTVAVAKGRLIFTKESSNSIILPQEKTLTDAGDENDAYVFTPLTGSWRNASEVVISGGVLELEHSRVFGKTTDVRFVGDAGRLQLDAGVKQRCHFLEIGGVRQELGTWGGPESSAEHKSELFTGTGVLAVYGDGDPGLTLILR